MLKYILSIGIVMSFISGYSQTRIVPHVTAADGDFSTTLVIENTSVISQSLTLTPYSIDGAVMEDVQLDVAAQAVMRADAHTLLGASSSHVVIDGSDEIKINTYYDFKAGNSNPAFVGESQQQGSSWRLFTGNWEQVFDGIAVVNMGSVPTDVWIAQKNDQNEVIATRKIATALAPYAKALYVIGSPSKSEFASVDSYFEVSGDQYLAVTALQGTHVNDTLNILLASESRALSKSSSTRDDKAVWFIEDGDMYDIFEMMGDNVATDRLWQMESFRRQARGTLGEIISVTRLPTVAAIDALNRRKDFSDEELEGYFQNLDSESQIMIKSYVAGVNRRIGQVNQDSDLLPIEFTGLGEDSVTDWTYRDLMSHLASFQQGFSMRALGSEQVLNGVLLQELVTKYGTAQGALMFNDMRYVSDPQSMTMIAGGTSKTTAKANQAQAFIKEDLPDIRREALEYAQNIENMNRTLEENGLLIKGGSYAWAVSGGKTDSGNPMLYSGPQVGFSAPVLFVEGSIKSDVLTASGMIIPGIPAIIVGRTPHHAWSMQVGYAGTWDYYLENPADVSVVRQEIIKVKDGADVVLDIEASSHGPILQDLGGLKLAYKYSHRDYSFELSKGLLNLSRSESMDEFGEAVGNLGVSQHLCYVDKNGNIAYWHAGRQPVRPAGDYRVPQGMLAGQPVLEWDAAVVEDPAHERNPAKGYFGGWNNKPDPDFIDYSATTALGPYHRGNFIRDIFETRDPSNKWSYEEFRDVAIDIGATGGFAAGGNPWTQLGQAITEAIEANPTDERTAALNMFQSWDGYAVSGGPSQWVWGTDIEDASVMIEAMIPMLMDMTFQDEMGAITGLQDMITRFQVMLHGFYETGLNNNYDWFTNLEDETAPQTRDGVILAVVDLVLAQLGERPWGTDARGTINYPHFLFGPITNLGVTTPTLLANRSTYAQCLEYDNSGPVRIESIFALGQSGTITGSLIQPQFDVNALSQKENFDNFILNVFPLFQ